MHIKVVESKSQAGAKNTLKGIFFMLNHLFPGAFWSEWATNPAWPLSDAQTVYYQNNHNPKKESNHPTST
jgi:hypothetical protein